MEEMTVDLVVIGLGLPDKKQPFKALNLAKKHRDR